MTDVFQVLRWEIAKDLFSEEIEYLKRRRWDFAQHKPDIFVALNTNCFSLRHLDEIRRMMDNEAKEKEEAEKRAEAEKLRAAQIEARKASSGVNLTGSHRYV